MSLHPELTAVVDHTVRLAFSGTRLGGLDEWTGLMETGVRDVLLAVAEVLCWDGEGEPPGWPVRVDMRGRPHEDCEPYGTLRSLMLDGIVVEDDLVYFGDRLVEALKLLTDSPSPPPTGGGVWYRGWGRDETRRHHEL